MDPALLKERELFQKRAITTAAIGKRKREQKSVKDEGAKKNSKPPTTREKLYIFNYKTTTGNTQYKFCVLAKIVQLLKARHHEGNDHPLSMQETLDQTHQLDVGSKIKQWLQTEALINNPKIEVTSDGRFLFKPMYKIKNKKSLLRLLKQQDLKGLGGILLEDIQESLPHCDKHLKSLQDEILCIPRPLDKKTIIFYNDKTAQLPIDDQFQTLWRAVAVDAMDDQKIDEYLEKQGIRSMQDHGLKKSAPLKRRNPVKRRRQFKPKDNEHVADVLETYAD